MAVVVVTMKVIRKRTEGKDHMTTPEVETTLSPQYAMILSAVMDQKLSTRKKTVTTNHQRIPRQNQGGQRSAVDQRDLAITVLMKFEWIFPNSRDLTYWLDKAEQYFELREVKVRDCVQIAPCYLDVGARQWRRWFEHTNRDQAISWGRFSRVCCPDLAIHNSRTRTRK